MYKNKVESSLCVSVKCHIFIWNKARYALFVIYILSFWFLSRDALDVTEFVSFTIPYKHSFFWYWSKYKNFNRYKAAPIPSTLFSFFNLFELFNFFPLFLYYKFREILDYAIFFQHFYILDCLSFQVNFLRINFFSFFLQF